MVCSCYTLDVNPTSASRVKVRLYETRRVEAGGNILLLQGQLSVKQFQLLEGIFLAGAAREGASVVRSGRHYSSGQVAEPRHANADPDDEPDGDYTALALRHVERMLRRQRALAAG